MTSTSSPDEPTLRRGTTLTPESPRPLHMPEASHIPVLQNQIDPVFNLMSTHLEPPYALRDLTAMDHHAAPANDSPQHDIPLKRPLEAQGAHVKAQMEVPLDLENANEPRNIMSVRAADIEAGFQESSPLLHSAVVAAPTDEGLSATTSLDHAANAPSSLDPSPPSHSLTKDVAQSHPISSEAIDTHSAETPATMVASSAPPAPPVPAPQAAQAALPSGGSNANVNAPAVDFQALLDHIVAPTLTSSGASDVPLNGNAASAADYSHNAASSLASASVSLPASAGLPPRPPPQAKPAIHPNYVPGEDIRSYHFPPPLHGPVPINQPQQNASYRPPSYGPPISGIPPSSLPGANGLPPPPMPSFQQPLSGLDNGQPIQQQRPLGGLGKMGNMGRNGGMPQGHADDTESLPGWGPDVQRKYEEFLDDERIYTAEGTWEKFPPGSRLFVGNLPSEVVGKREIFNIFHKYGRLAQISIKQAYGFVQFLEANACHAALREEQGGRLAERNMHLEISKPPKNLRNAQPTAAGDSLRASYYRRSRSPEYGRGPPSRQKGLRNGGDRFADSRDEPRRRDDYRPGRSPSPRGGRGRNDYRNGRDRSPPRYYSGRSRSRSPPYGRGPQRYRSPSPRRRSIDDDDALPLPHRVPRDVPDVQLLLIDELDLSFVAYVEKTFRDNGLSCATLKPPHVPLATVIKRQILEGVKAVVKLYHGSQVTGKIPLQVFDRSGGADQVRFDEYDDQEVHIAAALVLRSQATQAATAMARGNTAPQPYGATQIPHAAPPLGATNQPNLAHLMASLDGPALQQLLGAMQPAATTQGPQGQDFAAILGGLTGQAGNAYPPAPQTQGFQYPTPGPSPQGPPLAAHPYPYPPPNQPAGQTAPPYQQPQAGHVQNIMEQLAKWKQ